MLEFKIKYTEKGTLEKGSFKMVLKGMAFYFEDITSNKLVNPFFCSNENQVAIAREVFKEDSVLLIRPTNLMNFTTDALAIEITSTDL